MYIVYFYLDDNIVLFCDDDMFGYNFDTWDSYGFKHSDSVKELKGNLIYFKSIEQAMETLNRVKDMNVLIDFLGDYRTIEEVHKEYGLSIGLYEEVLPYNYDKLKLDHLKDRLNHCLHMKKEFDYINDKDMGTRIILGKIFTIVMELDPYYKNIRNQIPVLNKKIELIYEDYIGMKTEKISVYELIHNIWYYDIGLDYPYNHKFLSANEVKLSDTDIVDKLLNQIELVISKLKKRSFRHSQIEETARHIIMNLGHIR